MTAGQPWQSDMSSGTSSTRSMPISSRTSDESIAIVAMIERVDLAI